jgi:hypothetical protein
MNGYFSGADAPEETHHEKRRRETNELCAQRALMDVSTFPIRGELHNWHVMGTPSGSKVVWGNIYQDTSGEFYEGQFIRTSKIAKIENEIAVTANSAYRLVGHGMETP